MDKRYEVIVMDGGDHSFIMDKETGEPVRTQDGTRIYEAPVENAQWTADALNRNATWKKVMQAEPDPSDFDQAQAELARDKASTLENRLEPTEDVLARLEPFKTDSKSYAYKLGQAQGDLINAKVRVSSLTTTLAVLRHQTSSDYVRDQLDVIVAEMVALRDMLKTAANR